MGDEGSVWNNKTLYLLGICIDSVVEEGAHQSSLRGEIETPYHVVAVRLIHLPSIAHDQLLNSVELCQRQAQCPHPFHVLYRTFE